MKKIILSIFVLMTFVSPAFAVPEPAETNFPQFHTVDNDNSNTKKDTFGWNETPWAYGLADGVGANRHVHMQTDWFFNSTLLGEADQTGASGDNNFWLSPSNWNSIKAAGIWTINGYFQVHNDSNDSVFKTGVDTHSFTVTPEPVSMALFGLGAGALGLARRRKKK